MFSRYFCYPSLVHYSFLVFTLFNLVYCLSTSKQQFKGKLKASKEKNPLDAQKSIRSFSSTYPNEVRLTDKIPLLPNHYFEATAKEPMIYKSPNRKCSVNYKTKQADYNHENKLAHILCNSETKPFPRSVIEVHSKKENLMDEHYQTERQGFLRFPPSVQSAISTSSLLSISKKYGNSQTKPCILSKCRGRKEVSKMNVSNTSGVYPQSKSALTSTLEVNSESGSSVSSAKSSSLMKFDISLFQSNSSLSTGHNLEEKGAQTQVGKAGKAGVSLMKSVPSKEKVGRVKIASSLLDNKLPTLNNKKQHQHLFEVVGLYLKGNSKKYAGNIMQADKHSSGTKDNRVLEYGSAGDEYAYLHHSKENDDEKEEEKVESSKNRNDVAHSHDINKSSDYTSVNNNATTRTTLKNEKNNNKPFNSNSRINRNATAITQLMAQIAKDWEKGTYRENGNLTVIVNIPSERQKEYLDRNTRSPSSHLSEDQQSRSHYTTYATDRSGSSGKTIITSLTKNSDSNAKIMKSVSLASSIDNLTEMRTEKEVSLPVQVSGVESSSRSSVNRVLSRSGAEQPGSVLEKWSLQNNNNSQLQKIKTGKTTGLLLKTKNCSEPSSSSQKQACSVEKVGTWRRVKGTIEMALFPGISSEHNTSQVGNVNDHSLTASCKCQTKQEFNFPVLRNSRQDVLELSSFRDTRSTSRNSRVANKFIIGNSIITTGTRSATSIPQKNQLAKLDTQTRSDSFELNQIVVGTKAKSISSKSLGSSKSAFTPPLTSLKERMGMTMTNKKNYPVIFNQHIRHTHERGNNKISKSAYDFDVTSATTVPLKSSKFLRWNEHKRSGQDVMKEINLSKNFVRQEHRVVQSPEREWMLITLHLPITNNNFKENYTTHNFLETNRRKLFPTFTRNHDISNERPNQNDMNGKKFKTNWFFKTANKNTNKKPNKKFTSKTFAHKNNDDDVPYRLQLKTKSLKKSHMSMKNLQYVMHERMAKFIAGNSFKREINKMNLHPSSFQEHQLFRRKAFTALESKRKLSAPSSLPGSRFFTSSSVPSKLISLKRDIQESSQTMTRSSNRKWKLAEEKKTAQGEEILGKNHEFSSRRRLVNRTEHKGTSQAYNMAGGDANVSIELDASSGTHTTTHQDDDGIQTQKRYDDGNVENDDGVYDKEKRMNSNVGENSDPIPGARPETKAFTQLLLSSLLLPRSDKVNTLVKSGDATGEVKRMPYDNSQHFAEQENDVFKRIKRDTRCISTSSDHPVNKAMRIDEGSGQHSGEDRATLETRNQSRKFIPMKGNPVAPPNAKKLGEWTPTISPQNMNTNNKGNLEMNSRKLNVGLYYKVSGTKEEPYPSKTSFSSLWETRSENGRMAQKMDDDESEKVLTSDYNFMSGNRRRKRKSGWYNNHLSTDDNGNDGRRIKLCTTKQKVNSSVQTTLPVKNTPTLEVEHSVSDKLSSHHTTSSQGHANAVRGIILGNKHHLQTNMSSFSYENMLLETKAMKNDAYFVTKDLLRFNGNDAVTASSLSSFSMASTTTAEMVVTNQAQTETVTTLQTEEENANGLGIAAPSATASSTNYDFDSSLLPLLTSTTVTSTPFLLNSIPSIFTTAAATLETKAHTEQSESYSSTTNALPNTNSEYQEVKATNGFTQKEESFPSTLLPNPSSSTVLIEQPNRNTDMEGELATTPFISTTTTLQQLTHVSLSDTDAVSRTSTNGISAIDLTTRVYEGNMQEVISTTSTYTDNVSPSTLITFETTTTTVTPNQITSATGGSHVTPTGMSPSQPLQFTTISTTKTAADELTTLSATVDLSPTEIPSTEQHVSETYQPTLATTLMSTSDVNLENAIISTRMTMTTTVLPTSSATLSSAVEGSGSEEISTNSGNTTTTYVTTVSTTLQTTVKDGNLEENIKGNDSSVADTPPMECDHSKGMVYCEESKKCVCATGMLYDDTKKRCINLVGNECLGEGETSNGDCPLNSLCKPQEVLLGSQKSLCVCDPGYISAHDKSQCMAGWNTTCSHLSDININNQCHPDFDCVSEKMDEVGGKCICKANMTLGMSYASERSTNDTWKNEQQIKCFLDYGSDCDPLNDKCNDFRFLKCSRQNAKCECADPGNQLYDERTHECVAKAGTFCSLTVNSRAISEYKEMNEVRFLACIGNSSCVRVGNETESRFSGTCKCLDGYDQHWQGYCTMKGAGSYVGIPNRGILGLLCLVGFFNWSKRNLS